MRSPHSAALRHAGGLLVLAGFALVAAGVKLRRTATTLGAGNPERATQAATSETVPRDDAGADSTTTERDA